MVPELKEAAKKLFQNADPKLTRVGDWNTIKDARFYVSEGKMIVTESNGTFLTMIGKTVNKWYLAAKSVI